MSKAQQLTRDASLRAVEIARAILLRDEYLRVWMMDPSNARLAEIRAALDVLDPNGRSAH